MNKVIAILILATLAIVGLTAIPGSVSMTVTGTDIPEAGDWVIKDATVVAGETIEFTGLIIIEDGGSLTLNDVTLNFKSSTHGKCGIKVEDGGTFVTNGGSIAKSGMGNWSFRGFSGATVTLVNTTMSYIGYQIVDYSLNTVTEDYRFSGIWLECDATIEGCTIDKTFNGIIPENGTVTITGSTVSNGNWHNIEGRGATIIMEDCVFHTTLEQCNVELYWDCDAVLRDSIIYSAWHENVWASPRVKMTIENNKIYNSNQGGIWFKEDCDVTITNNEIYDNARFGIWLEKNCVGTITGNTITNNGDPTNADWDGNGQGIVVLGSTATITDNTVEGSFGDTFLAEDSEITATGNTFKGSKEDENVVIRESSGTLSGNTITGSVNDAIYAQNSTLTISGNTIDTAGGYAICNVGSTLTTSDNTITSASKGEEFKSHYMRFKTMDKDGGILGNTNITLKDSTGNVAFNGMTGIDGWTGDVLVIEDMVYTVEAQWVEYTGTSEVTATASTTEVTIELKEEKEKSKASMGLIMAIVVVILIIPIIVVIAVFMMKKKQKPDESTDDR